MTTVAADRQQKKRTRLVQSNYDACPVAVADSRNQHITVGLATAIQNFGSGDYRGLDLRRGLPHEDRARRERARPGRCSREQFLRPLRSTANEPIFRRIRARCAAPNPKTQKTVSVDWIH